MICASKDTVKDAVCGVRIDDLVVAVAAVPGYLGLEEWSRECCAASRGTVEETRRVWAEVWAEVWASCRAQCAEAYRAASSTG